MVKEMQLTDKSALEKLVKRLNRVDFGPIAYKLIDHETGEGWTIEQATEAIEQYRRFLLLHYLYPDRRLVPTRNVDIVWHHHILDTSQYQKDCLEVFGHFLHHYPYAAINDDDKQASSAALAETRELWARHFS
jgi:hypothetical protein